MWIELKHKVDVGLINLSSIESIVKVTNLDTSEWGIRLISINNNDYEEMGMTREQAQARYDEIKSMLLNTKEKEFFKKEFERIKEFGDMIEKMMKVGGSE